MSRKVEALQTAAVRLGAIARAEKPSETHARLHKPMPKEAPDALLAVADAAVAWWAGLRPVAWSLEQHLSNPRINATNSNERALALRVAEWCALQRGIPTTPPGVRG